MLEGMTLCEEVFHTASGIAFADFVTDGHRETWPIRSKRFRTWLRRCYYQANGTAPSGSVEDVISRPDLADRAIFLTLAPIGEVQRRPEAKLWREFEIVRPRILGVLLDAVSYGLRTVGHVQLDALPRMADFALWITACEPAL